MKPSIYYLSKALDRVMALGLRDDECWPWPGKRNKDGYGKTYYPLDPGRERLAHRAVYEAVHGEITDPKICVLHKCDNRPCCNSRHLFEGTRTLNAKDRDAKKRHQYGDRHYATILPDEKVIELRRAHEDGVPLNELAKKYKIKYKHAWKIATRAIRKIV